MAVIDTLTFGLAPGVEDNVFLEVDRRMQTEVIYQQPGLLRRTTARGDDGSWLVVTLWESMSAFEASAGEANAIKLGYLGLLDPASVVAAYFTTID